MSSTRRRRGSWNVRHGWGWEKGGRAGHEDAGGESVLSGISFWLLSPVYLVNTNWSSIRFIKTKRDYSPRWYHTNHLTLNAARKGLVFSWDQVFFSLLASGEITANIDLAPIYNCWSRQATKEENLGKSVALFSQKGTRLPWLYIETRRSFRREKSFSQTRFPLSTATTRVLLKICLRLLGVVEMKWQP